MLNNCCKNISSRARRLYYTLTWYTGGWKAFISRLYWRLSILVGRAVAMATRERFLNDGRCPHRPACTMHRRVGGRKAKEVCNLCKGVSHGFLHSIDFLWCINRYFITTTKKLFLLKFFIWLRDNKLGT